MAYPLGIYAGHAMAQYTLGKQYMSGRGVAQDINKAVGSLYHRFVPFFVLPLILSPRQFLELYGKAAAQGYKRAQLRLGRMYETGMPSANLPKSAIKAAEMYQMVRTRFESPFLCTDLVYARLTGTKAESHGGLCSVCYVASLWRNALSYKCQAFTTRAADSSLSRRKCSLGAIIDPTRRRALARGPAII